jgi:hypothetical protein
MIYMDFKEDIVMAEYNIKVTVPGWVEWMVVWPMLVYRKIKYGYVFRRIRLTRGQWAKVDPEWYERLKRYKWHVNMEGKGGKGYYATRMIRKKGKCIKIWMHKVVLPGRKGFVVDHINRDKLDNRRANLRVATPKQNVWNSERGKNQGLSKYKGVTFDRRSKNKKWRAVLCADGKFIRLGYFADEVEAARAYDRAALKYKGEFAVLNFPST